MGIKHRKATAYKAGIDEKTKKLKDTSITTEQRKVIQQDLEKLKETHNKHVEAVEKNFNEQIKAAPKEEQEKLKKEKEAFKSKYGSASKAEDSSKAKAPKEEAKADENEDDSDDNQDADGSDNNQGVEGSGNNQDGDGSGNNDQGNTNSTDNNQGGGANQDKAEAAEKAEKAEKAIKGAIEKGKYQGFSNLTVKKFAEAKNLSIENLNNETLNKSLVSFYDGDGKSYVYEWKKVDTKAHKCKVEICKKIIESKDIGYQMSYDALKIDQDNNKNCYENGQERVKLDNEAHTFKSYWEHEYINLLDTKDITIDNAGE